MNNLSCKKVFFIKEIFFSFTKNSFFSSGKTFFLIYKNLTASALLMPQILYNGDMPRQKPQHSLTA